MRLKKISSEIFNFLQNNLVNIQLFHRLLANTHDATLMLMQPLEGMQDIELHLTMNVYSNEELRGKSVAKVFIYVSQYAF